MPRKTPKAKKLKGGFEPKVLAMLEKVAGVTIQYEPDKFKYVTTHIYTPDFKVTLPSGKEFYLESKGYFKYEDRSKMVAMKAQYPDLDIRMLFQRDNKLGKGTYSSWCEKNNIKSAIGEPPDDWFED